MQPRDNGNKPVKADELGSLRLNIVYTEDHVFPSEHYSPLRDLVLHSASVEVELCDQAYSILYYVELCDQAYSIFYYVEVELCDQAYCSICIGIIRCHIWISALHTQGLKYSGTVPDFRRAAFGCGKKSDI